MLGLHDQRAEQSGRKGHVYPDAVAAYMLYLKQLYPSIHWREIERIVQRKFGYKTNHHTIKHFFERHPIPVQLEFDLPLFSDFADAYEARWTVVRMAYEGWNKKSIAGCLQLSRTHVSTILKAFDRDGFEGLEDQRTRPAHHPDDQLTLPFLKEVLDLQKEYPRAGRFRLYGLLEQQRAERHRVSPRWAEPWRLTGACTARPVPGEARETRKRRSTGNPNTCPIGLCIATTSGMSIFATWSNSRAAGSTAQTSP